MKTFKLTTMFLLLLLSFGLVSAQVDRTDAERITKELSVPQLIRTVVVKVVGINDGDTITVLDADKRQYKIHFNGIDAPELK